MAAPCENPPSQKAPAVRAPLLRIKHHQSIRAGFESLAAVEALRQDNLRVGLHGSMVEVPILGMRPCDQTATDLLNARDPCYVDASYHIQGARQMPLNSLTCRCCEPSSSC
jgi:hypothetical protein